MKRIWRIIALTQVSDQLCLSRGSPSTLRTLTPFCFTLFRSPKHPSFPRQLCDQSRGPHIRARSHKLSSIFTRKSPVRVRATPRDDMVSKASLLKDELVRNCGDADKVTRVLEENEKLLLERYRNGVAFVELMKQLRPWPILALEVFNWRRNKAQSGGISMTSNEYAKGIAASGRLKHLELAEELFDEAANKQLNTTLTYNALMGAFLWNGLLENCKQVFGDLKKQSNCTPSVATYNILISLYGHRLMVDQMEAVFQELKDLKTPPNISTYNTLINEYIRAWMWDKMEATFTMMKTSSLKPNMNTYLLMLRGYANSGNVARMEEMYEAVKRYGNKEETPLLEPMIWAYYRSSDKDKVKKIENLSKLIPRESYMPWLNVLMIRMYAQDDNLEAMENYINEAFEKQIKIETFSIIREVVASYFRGNAVDKLAKFMQRAQVSGWRLCRSLYHGLMILYGSSKRFKEMEKVLHEMDKLKIRRVKKTFCILHQVYTTHGYAYNADQVAGMMLKHGHGFPRPSMAAPFPIT